jgi:hypothetical protein
MIMNENNETHKINDFWQIMFIVICLSMIAVGVYFRYSWRNWSEGANLHPDEYGLTGTLTQLQMPLNFSEYLNTRISPISPYNRYDEIGALLGNGPDNRMRWGQWPIIIIRTIGELTKNIGYDEIRLLGRMLSATADCVSLILLFFIGIRLFNWKTALLATSLSALTVLQIQQSHYMTVDTFALMFTMLAFYASIRIAQTPAIVRKASELSSPNQLVINKSIWSWIVLFGVGYGMAVASKINLAVLGALLPASFFISIVDIKLRYRQDIAKIIRYSLVIMFTGCLATFIVFRVTQPASFRAVTGNTTLFTLHLNQDWVDSMKVAAGESSGVGGGPPAEQWTHRTAILFPLMNMVFWGMGLPLGVTCWVGIGMAGWLLLRKRLDWQIHLLPFCWATVYFLFMGTRWVKSVRYFLPIYPFLCLYAAWLLIYFLQKAFSTQEQRATLMKVLASASLIFVMGGTLIWSNAFVNAVYIHRHTRILASEWMFAHIPGAVNFVIETDEGEVTAPVAVPDNFELMNGSSYCQTTIIPVDGRLVGIYLPKLSGIANGSSSALQAAIRIGEDTIQEGIPIPFVNDGAQSAVRVELSNNGQDLTVRKGQMLTLEITNPGESAVQLQKMVLSNENWDEGLPVRTADWDPFSQLYVGNTMEVRWYDDENKKTMFLETMNESDYLIVPSQRAVWSAIRMPVMYPMTIDYYRALFSGKLGFELVAEFQTPYKIGALQISDVGGTWALGKEPEIPVFNFNALAAEEAFSVYDHPPVWIFKKTDKFNVDDARRILDAADLSQVIIQSPPEATFYKTKY